MINIYFGRSKVGTVELKSILVAVTANPVWLAMGILAKTVANACRCDVGAAEEGVDCLQNSNSSSRLIHAYVHWDTQEKIVR